MKHPIQPIVTDDHGVYRFKANTIIQHLFNTRVLDLNEIAVMSFPVEDRVQLAQLIGYSISGFGDLSYVSNDDYRAAYAMTETDNNEKDAKIQSLEATLDDIRVGLKKASAAAFRIAEEDLNA